MCDPVTLTLATTAVVAGGQIYQGAAQKSAAKYDARVANQNRQLELQARNDAAERGVEQQKQHWRRVSQQYGQQRAMQAASGLDISFGSPADLLSDVQELGAEDSKTIAANTAKEIKGYEINAANYVMQGRAAKSRGKAAMTGAVINAFGTVLGGATQVSKMKAGR